MIACFCLQLVSVFLPPVILSYNSFWSGPFRDCLEAQEAGHSTSGMYLIRPDEAERPLQVYCEQEIDSGGWTVIQSRRDGSVNFFRNWDNYKVMAMPLHLPCLSCSLLSFFWDLAHLETTMGAIIWHIKRNHLGSFGLFPESQSFCFHLL